MQHFDHLTPEQNKLLSLLMTDMILFDIAVEMETPTSLLKRRIDSLKCKLSIPTYFKRKDFQQEGVLQRIQDNYEMSMFYKTKIRELKQKYKEYQTATLIHWRKK